MLRFYFPSPLLFYYMFWVCCLSSVNIQMVLWVVCIKLYLQEHANWKELHCFTHKEINDFLINCLIKTKNLDDAKNSWLEKLFCSLCKNLGCTGDRKQSCKIHSGNHQTVLSNKAEGLFVYSVHKTCSSDIKAREQSNTNWVINLVALSSLAKANNAFFRKKKKVW